MNQGKCIVFVNQSPNQMLCDIADACKNKGYSCILLCGYAPPEKQAFSEVVLLNKYERSSALKRLTTWIRFTGAAFKWLSKKEGISILFVVSNPPFLLYLPFFKKKFRKSDIRMQVYDLYPDIMQKLLPAPISLVPSLIMKRLNKISFSYAHYIYTPSESLSRAVQKYTDAEVKTVFNWVDLTTIKPVAKAENQFLLKHGLKNKFIVLYSGNLGATHDPFTILETAALLKQNDSVLFLFIGGGEGMKEVENYIANGGNNCLLFPFQHELFTHSIACGDLALVSYKTGFEEYSIPSKLPYYLATGTPVLLIGNINSELAGLLQNNDIGFAVENGQAKEMAALINRLNSVPDVRMKQACIDFANNNLSKKNALMFVNQ